MVNGLTITDAVVTYDTRATTVTAVDRVSLHVEPGEVVALLGASGSGKSSLLRAIAGLEPLASGSVAWDGADLAGVPTHRRGFGMIFQDAALFPTMDVGRNVAYGLGRLPRSRRAERVAELLELVGLPGYERRRTTELSGGQAQRVALARSLAPEQLVGLGERSLVPDTAGVALPVEEIRPHRDGTEALLTLPDGQRASVLVSGEVGASVSVRIDTDAVAVVPVAAG